MSKPKLIRVCAGCGQRWAGAVCRWCGGLADSHVPVETATRIADRYQDALLAKIDGPIPAEWAEQHDCYAPECPVHHDGNAPYCPLDAETEETNRLLFGGPD